jgi:hypothetical protein
VLVHAVLDHDQVDFQVAYKGHLNLPNETREFLALVAGFALGDHLAGGYIQGGKQGGGAMVDVAVGNALHITQPHGQQGLSAIQELDLRLPGDAEHHGSAGRLRDRASAKCWDFC